MDTVDQISSETTLIHTRSQSFNLEPNDKRFELMILSEAGKPIYTFTKREDAVTLMPLCSALIDYAQRAQKEVLQTIKTSDNLVISFSKRSPLIIIVVHDVNSYVDAQVLVEQVEAQIMSILTAKSLKSVFEERPTFDLKRLLYGSEKLIDATTKLSAFSKYLDCPWVESFLAAKSSKSNQNIIPTMNTLPQRPHRILIPVVTMPPNIRDIIHGIILNGVNTNSNKMVFTLLFRIGSGEDGDNSNSTEDSMEDPEFTNDGSTSSNISSESHRYRLITVCNHHDRHKLKVADIHIILALICGSRAQLKSAESLWMPVCLPRFNQDAFLHSYISFIDQSRHCLVMMSIDRDEFANCQRARNLVEEKIENFMRHTGQQNKIFYQMSPLVHPILLKLQDKLTGDQLTSEELAQVQQKAQIYNSRAELYHARQIQFLWYQTHRQVLWWQRSGRYRPNAIIYYLTKKMLKSSLKHLWVKMPASSLLGWHSTVFQLYAQFDSTTTTNEAVEIVQRITNWIKKEEDNFSIKDYR